MSSPSATAPRCAARRIWAADVARVLIVGCGCRGRALAEALSADGHAVRGTSRTEEGCAAIAAAGIEAALADPERLGTVMAQLPGVSVVCWLMGSATGDAEQLAGLHGMRLRTLLERLVDTPVRGLVYEAAGSCAPELLQSGEALVEDARGRWHMPVAVVDAYPSPVKEWVAAQLAAVAATLQ